MNVGNWTKRGFLVSNGTGASYNTKTNMITIGSCYLQDIELLELLLSHEKIHQDVFEKYGYKSLAYHVAFDTIDRWKFVNSDLYLRYMKLSRKNESVDTKDMLFSILYTILTLPTILFSFWGWFRLFFRFFSDKLSSFMASFVKSS